MEIKGFLLSGGFISLLSLIYLRLYPSAILSGLGFSFLMDLRFHSVCFNKADVCMCVCVCEWHIPVLLMDKHPPDRQTFQMLRWKGLMKCNHSLCFSSSILLTSGSHNDLTSCFSPKMNEVRRKLYLYIFREMSVERNLTKRFMVLLLEWHITFIFPFFKFPKHI